MFRLSALAAAGLLALHAPARAIDPGTRPDATASASASATATATASAAAAPAFTPGADAAAAVPGDTAAATARPGTPTATELSPVEVTTRRSRLDSARNRLSPEVGSSVYRFDTADIARLPLGDATPIDQVLLRSPGVVGDSGGQLHVRGDHANLQYRLNGVALPDSAGGFGAMLDTRFADRIQLLTGALPAQYGNRTAGIVDVRSKGSRLANGGSIDLTLGTRGHRELGANVGGTTGSFQYFVAGSLLGNDIGLENPTEARDALHDRTRQGRAFGYFSSLVGDASRVSVMLGSNLNRFEIPNVPGRDASYTLAGAATPESAQLDARQRERGDFQVLTFESSLDAATDYQVSLFRRASRLHYQPDPVGDLVYTGVAADVNREVTSTGIQLDASRALGAGHTLRAGVALQRDRATTTNHATVFPTDASGQQASDVPLTVDDDNRLGGHLLGVYLQDEWQPTAALTVNYGLRYDRTDALGRESQWSPRLGAVWQLGADTRLHAGYARYFTPPPTESIDTTSVTKFLDTTNALPSDANTAVRSERSHYFDVGLSHQLDKRVTLGIDAYYRDVRHLQDEGQFGNALVYSAFNYAHGRVMGLELSASYRDDRLSTYANVALSSAKAKGIESGQFNFEADELAYIESNWVHLDHDQKLAASAGVSYRFGDAANSTTLGGDVLYGSGLRRGFANTERMPAWTQVNASVLQKFTTAATGAFDVRLAVLNLFDRSYEMRDGTGIGVGAPKYGPRRSVYLTLSKPFTF